MAWEGVAGDPGRYFDAAERQAADEAEAMPPAPVPLKDTLTSQLWWVYALRAVALLLACRPRKPKEPLPW